MCLHENAVCSGRTHAHVSSARSLREVEHVDVLVGATKGEPFAVWRESETEHTLSELHQAGGLACLGAEDLGLVPVAAASRDERRVRRKLRGIHE